MAVSALETDRCGAGWVGGACRAGWAGRTWQVGLGAAGFVAGAEGAGRAGVTVLRLWAAASQTPDLAVRPVHHLDELPHPGPEDKRTTALRGRGAQRRQKQLE